MVSMTYERFVRSFRAFLVLTALIALICVCLGQEVPLSEMKISCVHLTLGEGPASMVVTWRSSLVTEDAVVKAWPAGLKTMPTSGKDLIRDKFSQHTYKFARDTVNIYDAILGGLEPNAAYNYYDLMRRRDLPRLFVPIAGRGRQYPVYFRGSGRCRGDYPLFGKLIRMAREAGARFVIATGDLTDSGTQPNGTSGSKAARKPCPTCP